MSELAAIVAKERADSVIESLRHESIYDSDRRIREHDDEAIEIPITAPPEATAIRSVIEQIEPDYRITGLEDYLRARGWDSAEIAAAPNSWAVVGEIVLVRLPEDCPRPAEVGEALLDLQGADTVLARHGIAGSHREPEITVLAGSGDTETVHTEHGTKYALDLAEVMFSPGNQAERVRMGQVVAPDERVLDMFAGIGYFTLPMARANAHVTAIERNPTAFRYLLENTTLNNVTDNVTPYRADCRAVTDWHNDSDTTVDVTADRIIMGYYDAYEYLDAALAVLRPGGMLHMHEATPDALLWDRPITRLETAAATHDRTVTIENKRRVKTHAEGVYHVVLDARID